MDADDVPQLTPEQCDAIVEALREIYSDFPPFSSIASELKQAVLDTNDFTIDENIKKKIAEDYIDRRAYCTEKLITDFKIISQIFKAAYALVLYQREMDKQLANPKETPSEEVIWPSIETFLAEYPEFVFESEAERQLLHKFRNYTKIATMFITPRLGKQLILNIGGRLEGSQCDYITGGGQRQEVTNRVNIYEREGGWTAEARPDRATSKTKKKPAKGAAPAPVPAPVVVPAKATKRRASVVSISSGSDSDFEERPKKRKKSPKNAQKKVIPAPEPIPAPTTPAPAPQPQRKTRATKNEPETLEFPVDWSSASQIVAQWDLPREDSYIRALLKGEVPDESL